MSPDNTVRPVQSNRLLPNRQPPASRPDISSACLFYSFNKQNKLNLLVSLIFLATTRLYITLVSEAYITKNMVYSSFTRFELFTLIRDQKAALLNMTMGLIHPSEEKIKETQANLDNMVTALNSGSITTLYIAQKSTYNYDLAMRQQSLQEAVKQKKTFYTRNDINQFITVLNKVYTIHVIPELPTYPSLEEEFVKAAQDLLDQGLFQQMVDSKQDTSTFEKLNTYLIWTYCSQMTNFQHLSWAWDLQRRDDEKLTDFAGRLENTISEAAVHIKNKYKKDNKVDLTIDMVFLIMGAMLMSEKVKDWNPNIYPYFVKTIDNHFTVIGIACEAQQYIDRGVKMDSTTSHDTAYYAHRPQQSSWVNRWMEPRQPPRSNNRSTHSQQSSSSKHGCDYYQTHRMHNCNTEPAICRN